MAIERIYVDHGLTGTNRERPGLRQAMAACRHGDTLVVTKLDRLARSLPDARDIVKELADREVKLSLAGSIHDPTDPVGRLLFNVLAMVAEVRVPTWIRMHVPARGDEGRQGQAAACRARSRNSAAARRSTSSKLYQDGEHTVGQLAELFSVARSTVYRAIERNRMAASVALHPAGTVPAMTATEQLRSLVEELSEEEAASALIIVERRRSDAMLRALAAADGDDEALQSRGGRQRAPRTRGLRAR